MAYGHFLQKALREAAPQGMWNFHGSLLPNYRGASPVETALASGDTETGVGLMQVVKEMDAGAVADVEVVHIGELDTGPALRAKVGEAVVPLLRRNLSALLAGELSLTEQDLSQVTYCRKMRKEDGAIDFSLSAMEIYNRLRAFTPWPGGYFDHGESRIKVGRASVAANKLSRAAPGIVLCTGSEVRVATSAGDICFHELQRPGARMLPAADFLRGYPIVAGDLLMGSLAEPLVR